MPVRRKSKMQGGPEDKLIREWLDSGQIAFSDLESLRISPLEVVVEKNLNYYQILSIPKNLGANEDLLLLLDFFTTRYHWFDNPSRETRIKSTKTAVLFINFLKDHFENIDSLPEAIIEFSNHLKAKTQAGGLKQTTTILRKIFNRAIAQKYPEVSQRPENYKRILLALSKIKVRNEDQKKKPALGQFLGISNKEYTNKQLLLGVRLGAMWLLEKISSFRRKLVSQPEIAQVINEISGKPEDQIEKLLPNNPYKLSKSECYASRACYEHWRVIEDDPLLIEWQFYNDKKFRHYSLDYGNENSAKPYPAGIQKIYISRCINHTNRTVRNALKGLGQKDQEWKVFRPVYHSARHTTRAKTVLWGGDWIKHSPIEKLLFVWLLSTERIQSSGIRRMHVNCIVPDNPDKPKSLQLVSLKLRRHQGRSLKRSEVRSQIYKRHHPPFKIYSDWKETCQYAAVTIADFNPTQILIPNSTAAISGNVNTDSKLEAYTLFRILITNGTLWQEAFLTENSSNPQEAKAFIDILRNRIISENSHATLKLPPDPISQSLILEKELETNQSIRDIAVNSSTTGHTVNTGRHIYKDGFLSAGASEIVEPVDAFIRRVGDERFKDALILANQLEQTTGRLTLSELKAISGIDDAQLTIERLIKNLPENDRILLTGELLHDGQKFIIETDFTAAIMSSYITHIERSMADILGSERTDTALSLLGQLMYLTQTLEQFPEDIKIAGEELKANLDFKFPPVI